MAWFMNDAIAVSMSTVSTSSDPYRRYSDGGYQPAADDLVPGFLFDLRLTLISKLKLNAFYLTG